MDYIYFILFFLLFFVWIFYLIPKNNKILKIKKVRDYRKKKERDYRKKNVINFIPSPIFKGKINNMVFKLDNLGLGYYKDLVDK